jgi:hypothetical protein
LLAIRNLTNELPRTNYNLFTYCMLTRVTIRQLSSKDTPDRLPRRRRRWWPRRQRSDTLNHEGDGLLRPAMMTRCWLHSTSLGILACFTAPPVPNSELPPLGSPPLPCSRRPSWCAPAMPIGDLLPPDLLHRASLNQDHLLKLRWPRRAEKCCLHLNRSPYSEYTQQSYPNLYKCVSRN